MKVSLSPKLRRFVEQKVTEGLYENPSDVVRDALRALLQKDDALRVNHISGTRADIESAAMIVLLMATRDMDDDIRMIMAEIKSTNAAKQKVRELIKDLNAWISNEMDQHRSSHPVSESMQSASRPPLTFSPGVTGSDATGKSTQPPILDSADASGVNLHRGDLHSARLKDMDVPESVLDGLRQHLDDMNEVTETAYIRLQMAMDRRSRLMSTLSNIWLVGPPPTRRVPASLENLIQMLSHLFGLSAEELGDLLEEIYRGGADGSAVAALLIESMELLAVQPQGDLTSTVNCLDPTTRGMILQVGSQIYALNEVIRADRLSKERQKAILSVGVALRRLLDRLKEASEETA